jgi:hypothetical protein
LRLRRQFDENEQSDDSEAYDKVDDAFGGAEYHTEGDAEGVPGFPNSNADDEIDDDDNFAPFWRNNEDHGEEGAGDAVGKDTMDFESPFDESDVESDSSSNEEGGGRRAAASHKTKRIKK